MSKFRPVSAVIFDMDGTILATEAVIEGVYREICEKFKKSFVSDVRLKILGTTEQNSCRTVIADCQLPCSETDFMRDYKSLTLERLGNCELLPGVERLIRHLHSKGIPIAIATSSSKDSVAVKTAKYKALFDLFHHVVTGSSDPEVKHGKPAPDIFLVAAKRFAPSIDPKDCLVIEDAPNGVKAAKMAGMQCVMVPDKNLPQDLQKEADLVLTTLEDFKPEEFGLPPF
ncbi:pseudouridine-5'-phosphatase-like [Culicoides brevitarsis]|uniref:pseudouridine-5'-phosphatase-like n=1 Tax=Culicoides brevitarsis TaxID=469753 RepID=UPI00307B2B8A